MANSTLVNRLEEKIVAHRKRVERLLKEFGHVEIDKVNIGQTIGGMRDIKALVTDISYLDPFEGIRFRGKTISETMALLPKPAGGEYPYVEGFWFFLLTGDVPTADEAMEVVDDFHRRAAVPQYVFDILRTMPRDSHPMTMFSAAILSMQRESKFARFYSEGYKKWDAWRPMYEDSTDIIAKLPTIAAYIYRMKYRSDTIIPPDYTLPLGKNFAHMMGIPAPYDDVARMYFIIHSDHESGNVSAHATHLVASALSDAYYSLSAGINGLAGPLHGLANQEVLSWIMDVVKHFGTTDLSKEQIEKYLWETLNKGQVIPGYGHAVLRKTDPRFEAQRQFCLKHIPNDPLVRIVHTIYDVAPKVLTEHGKTKNPWPNVDAHSGVIQMYFGVKEYDFYTVLFGVGRALGVLANITWDRALGYPIERPKSLTTEMLEEAAGIQG